MPHLPTPRGPLSGSLFAHLSDGRPLLPPRLGDADPLVDDDLQLALWSCYQLHYRGFDGIDDAAEWDADVLRFRAALEAAFEEALRAEHDPEALPDDPMAALRAIATWEGPPLSATVAAAPTRRWVAEFAVHRSAYQLKEADPHTWAIPRLHGPGRSAMIEIQSDEYGLGRPGEAHAELFAAAMAELGLDPTFGGYIDQLPATTLATDNLVSMFGLHRRLRGALIGHLALFEMTSVVPMARYGEAARQLGGLPALERFYQVHVEADAHHAAVALDEMVAGFLATEPSLAPDVTFGAAALARVEARFARHLLDAWRAGLSSLRANAAPAPAESRIPPGVRSAPNGDGTADTASGTADIASGTADIASGTADGTDTLDGIAGGRGPVAMPAPTHRPPSRTRHRVPAGVGATAGTPS